MVGTHWLYAVILRCKHTFFFGFIYLFLAIGSNKKSLTVKLMGAKLSKIGIMECGD